MRFWDSSALVSLLVGEAQTRRLLALLEADPVVLAFVCLDERLIDAASREGLPLLPG